jgi:hypothetical protein
MYMKWIMEYISVNPRTWFNYDNELCLFYLHKLNTFGPTDKYCLSPIGRLRNNIIK